MSIRPYSAPTSARTNAEQHNTSNKSVGHLGHALAIGRTCLSKADMKAPVYQNNGSFLDCLMDFLMDVEPFFADNKLVHRASEAPGWWDKNNNVVGTVHWVSLDEDAQCVFRTANPRASVGDAAYFWIDRHTNEIALQHARDNKSYKYGTYSTIEHLTRSIVAEATVNEPLQYTYLIVATKTNGTWKRHCRITHVWNEFELGTKHGRILQEFMDSVKADEYLPLVGGECQISLLPDKSKSWNIQFNVFSGTITATIVQMIQNTLRAGTDQCGHEMYYPPTAQALRPFFTSMDTEDINQRFAGLVKAMIFEGYHAEYLSESLHSPASFASLQAIVEILPSENTILLYDTKNAAATDVNLNIMKLAFPSYQEQVQKALGETLKNHGMVVKSSKTTRCEPDLSDLQGRTNQKQYKPDFFGLTGTTFQTDDSTSYKIGRPLGQGGFGCVYAIVDHDEIVVKVQWSMTCDQQTAMKERMATRMAQLRKETVHPPPQCAKLQVAWAELDPKLQELGIQTAKRGIVFGMVPKSKFLYGEDNVHHGTVSKHAMNSLDLTVIPWKGKTLQSVLSILDYDTKLRIMSQLIDEVKRMYDAGWVYTDVKLDNIVWEANSQQASFIDADSLQCNQYKNPSCTFSSSVHDTPLWRAPYNKEGNDGMANRKKPSIRDTLVPLGFVFWQLLHPDRSFSQEISEMREAHNLVGEDGLNDVKKMWIQAVLLKKTMVASWFKIVLGANVGKEPNWERLKDFRFLESD